MSNQTIGVSRTLPYSMIDSVVMIDETLSPIDKAVFGVLCVHSGIESKKCILKVKTIAKEAGCSERSAQNSLKTLEERGIIERTERFNDGSQVSSSYQIIGREAPCYSDTGAQHVHPAPQDVHREGAGDALGGCTTCTQNEKSFNDIKDSLTGEAPLPDLADMPLVFENGQPVTPTPELSPARNPEEVCTPDDAPDVMKQTAGYLLLKTSRQGLTWDEISALQDLAATQYPHRVQKEIDTAVTRFNHKGRPLSTLTFMYIAGSLQHQPTLGKKRKAKPKPAPAPVCTDEEAEAMMAEIEAMQAEFDREAGR